MFLVCVPNRVSQVVTYLGETVLYFGYNPTQGTRGHTKLVALYVLTNEGAVTQSVSVFMFTHERVSYVSQS